MSISFYPEGVHRDLDDPLYMNVSNTRGVEILQYLRVEFDRHDLVGSVDPNELLARIADADPIDTGVPAYERPRVEGQPRWIEGAIRPGYFAERFGELKVIAEYAREHHLRVVWS